MLSRPFCVSAAMVALGIIGGAVCDVAPARPVVNRAGYRVLEGDFHTHTAWSDGSLSPFGIVRQARRRGLDVVAVTEHNTVWPSRFARAYAGPNDPLVLTGQEVTTARFHIIAVGIEETVSPNQPLPGVVADIHAQHGVAIIAHPVPHYWPNILPYRELFDAAEVMHPLAFSDRTPNWRWVDMLRFYQEAKAPLGAIGSSDYHWMSVLGVCRTLVFVHEPVTPEGVVDAIREHHTVTIDRSGEPWGDPELVAALRADPYVPRAPDYDYQGSSTADRILRTIGWLGLLGMVMLRVTRSGDVGRRKLRSAAPLGGHATRRPDDRDALHEGLERHEARGREEALLR